MHSEFSVIYLLPSDFRPGKWDVKHRLRHNGPLPFGADIICECGPEDLHMMIEDIERYLQRGFSPAKIKRLCGEEA